MPYPKFVLGASTLQFSRGLQFPLPKPIEVIQALDRDAGGGLQVEDLGLTVRRRTLPFKSLPLADYNAAIDWFVNKARGALNSFTYHDETGATMTVVWANSIHDFQETSYQRFTGVIELEVVG